MVQLSLSKPIFRFVSSGLCLSLCSPTLFAQTKKVAASEYSVYAAVLRGIHKENRRDFSNKSHFVFIDETPKSEEPSGPPQKKYRRLIRTFETLNRHQATIARSFPPGEYSKTYHLISKQALDELFRQGEVEAKKQQDAEKLAGKPTAIDICGSAVWRPFYQRFPEASGYYRLSRVAFEGSFAMVQIQRADVCGGFDRTYVLTKSKKGWRVTWRAGSEWVS